MKVLEFGNQEVPISEAMYPEAEITLKPIEEDWWKIEGMWDGIFSFYNLNYTPLPLEMDVIKDWSDHMNEGALLHVFVPSFEFLCRCGMQNMLEPWVKPMLLDAANHFSMKQLRIMFHKAGLKIIKAKTGEGHIEKFGMQLILEQHYIVGQK